MWVVQCFLCPLLFLQKWMRLCKIRNQPSVYYKCSSPVCRRCVSLAADRSTGSWRWTLASDTTTSSNWPRLYRYVGMSTNLSVPASPRRRTFCRRHSPRGTSAETKLPIVIFGVISNLAMKAFALHTFHEDGLVVWLTVNGGALTNVCVTSPGPEEAT